MNIKRLADRAKKVVDERGGTDSLKRDGDELRSIAKGKGSLGEKVKAAGKALKDPGGADTAEKATPPVADQQASAVAAAEREQQREGRGTGS